ncbi:uncharacterized protein LOC129759125 [Uranotaenia lowii]|uniref:uncharacterized protein LOC129759125 n=1 Tax=Uranotaenia lowii TaxID=190385 RepID=UPI00247846E2|nr:uncharacterized protein LOC129759125 [Uranotaenia lowii]
MACDKCAKPTGDSDSILCQGLCSLVFHLKCAGLLSSHLKSKADNKNLLWVCDECCRLLKNAAFRRSLGSYESIIADMRTNQASLVAEVKSEFATTNLKLDKILNVRPNINPSPRIPAPWPSLATPTNKRRRVENPTVAPCVACDVVHGDPQFYTSCGPASVIATTDGSSYMDNGVKRHDLPAGKSDHLNLYYQNVGGINSCVSDYLLASSCSCYDIIALTETWLNDRTLSSQVFSSDYTVFRCDRGPNNSTKSTGGGVLIAIRSTLSAIPIYDESWNDQEFVWTRIDLGTKKLYVGVVYLPPDRTRNASFADSFSIGLSKLCSLTLPEDDIVIIGDFNLPGLKWIPSQGNFLFADPTRSSFTVPSNTILDSLSTATLREINSIENENGRMLDLCFISDGPQLATIEEAPTPLVKVVPHHPALLLSLDIPRAFAHIQKPGQFFLDFKNADFVAVSQTLDAIDWETELESSDPNAAAMKFSHIINYIIDRHVPKRSSVSNLRAPWVTKELRQMKTLKNKALRYYTRHKTLRAKNEYCKLNSAYKKLCSRCYQSYLIRIQRGFKTKPKSFWQYIKDQRKESGLPPSMFLDDNLATSEPEICDLFADKFRSVFDSNSISSDQVTSAACNVPHLNTWLNQIVVDDDIILKATAKLKHSLSAGPDGIPATFLKRYISHMLIPLKIIFQVSLDQSTFPSLWKEAYMFPVHKKGDRRNVNNYRGISALCAIAKLFELVVLEPIFSYCKPYFSNEQHGFMPKRSTTTNLLTFTSNVQDSFAMGSQTDVIYTDLSAAFDKVNHSIAIAKLDRIGICGSLLEWFRSYLVGRKLIVRIAIDMMSLNQADVMISAVLQCKQDPFVAVSNSTLRDASDFG